MQQTHSEQRKQTRHEVIEPLIIISKADSEKLGTLVNISLDGLMILGQATVKEGGVYQVAIERVDEQKKVLSIGIECLWINQAQYEEKSWSGYQIIDISDDDKAWLKDLINDLSS